MTNWVWTFSIFKSPIQCLYSKPLQHLFQESIIIPQALPLPVLWRHTKALRWKNRKDFQKPKANDIYWTVCTSTRPDIHICHPVCANITYRHTHCRTGFSYILSRSISVLSSKDAEQYLSSLPRPTSVKRGDFLSGASSNGGLRDYNWIFHDRSSGKAANLNFLWSLFMAFSGCTCAWTANSRLIYPDLCSVMPRHDGRRPTKMSGNIEFEGWDLCVVKAAGSA